MNYDRILTILASRYMGHDAYGDMYCRECDRRHGEHAESCNCWYYAKKLLARALREKGRA